MAYTEQTKAHALVSSAVRKGDLVRPDTCELCFDKPGSSHGNSKGKVKYQRPLIVAHHWAGYDQPLNVWWICASCNLILQNKHDGSLSKSQARGFVTEQKRKRDSRRVKIDPEMEIVAHLLRDRRGDKHQDVFAVELGIRVATYQAYENGRRNMSLPSVQAVGKWASKNDDVDMLQSLSLYALGFPLEAMYE